MQTQTKHDDKHKRGRRIPPPAFFPPNETEQGLKMLQIRRVYIVLGLLLSSVASAVDQVNVEINMSAYWQRDRVASYLVSSMPQLHVNYFFHEGLYWIYQDDSWHASFWHDGPWGLVVPEEVPVFILSTPERYRQQPS